MGDGIRFAALPLLAAVTLHNPVLVSAVTTVTTVPWLLFGIAAGAYVDRSDKRTVMALADSVRAAALLGTAGLLAVGRLSLPALLGLAFVLGVGEVLADCASFAILPSLVPADRLETANGRLYGGQTFGRDLAGHAVGGILFSLARVIPLLADAASFTASAALILGIPRQERQPRNPARPAGSFLREIAEGARFILADRLLRVLTLLAAVINAVFLGQVSILVLLVLRVLRLPPPAYGLLLALGAVGSVLGALSAQRARALIGREVAVLVCLLAIGISSLLLALGLTALVAAGYFLLGFATMLWNVIVATLRQSRAPGHLLGRTVGAARMVAWGTMPLGGVLYGLAASTWGIRVPFLAGGVLILAAGLAASPALLTARRQAAASHTAQPPDRAAAQAGDDS